MFGFRMVGFRMVNHSKTDLQQFGFRMDWEFKCSEFEPLLYLYLYLPSQLFCAFSNPGLCTFFLG